MRITQRLFLFGLIAFAAADVAKAVDLFAATAGGGAGELFKLDAATGAVIQDIGPLNDAASANYGMTGMAFNPTTGVLYGSTAHGNPNAATQDKLVTIDPTNGVVTPIGNFGIPGGGSMADITFDPTSGILYGIGTVGGAHLYSINTTTGASTIVGNSGFMFTSGGGVAVSPAGVVYGSPGLNNFGTYDKTTGAYTNITNPTKPAGGGYGALAFSGSVLYGLNLGTPAHLTTIDTTTGTVTDIAALFNNLDAIAFSPAASVLAGDYNNNGVVDAADYVLWRKNNGTSNSLGPNDLFGPPITLAQYTQWRTNFGRTATGGGVSVSSVPEPSSVLLLIAGIVGLLGHRRSCR